MIGKTLSSIVFSLLSLIVFSSAVIADDMEKLKELRGRLDGEERKLLKLRNDKQKLADDIGKIRSELGGLEQKRVQTRGEIGRIELELGGIEKSQGINSRSLADEVLTLEDSLVELYKVQKKRQGINFLLSADSASDLLRRGYSLSILTSEGDRAIDRLVKLREQLAGEKMRFDELLALRTANITELEVLTKSLEQKRKERFKLLEEAKGQERDQIEILSKLKGEAAELERTLASLMGEEKKEEPANAVDRSHDSFRGPGLKKGALQFPVVGKLIQGFGKSHHEEFSDLLVIKGLEIASGVGDSVRPVAQGRVMLAQVLPGFGNVVIVDHGKRYYSLYGRLASTSAKVGNVVTETDQLGLTGEPDHRGRNFYFELRYKGKAVDPREFFRRIPDVS